MNTYIKKLIESVFDDDIFNNDEDILSELKIDKHMYYPQTKEELELIIQERIRKEGNNCNLNDINVSEIKIMRNLFYNSNFNGDISKWDVRNVSDMSSMFFKSKFNGDISNWNVSNVTDMEGMFGLCPFNGDISLWDVSSVTNMTYMFYNSNFCGDISLWNLNSDCCIIQMFDSCPLEHNPGKQCKK